MKDKIIAFEFTNILEEKSEWNMEIEFWKWKSDVMDYVILLKCDLPSKALDKMQDIRDHKKSKSMNTWN